MHNDDTITGLGALGEQEFSRRGVLRIGGLTVAHRGARGRVRRPTRRRQPGPGRTADTCADAARGCGHRWRAVPHGDVHALQHHRHPRTGQEARWADAQQTAIVDDYIAANKAAIADLQQWSVTAGSKKWTCANPRFDRVVLQPISGRITGRPKEGAEETDVPPSDDPNRDCYGTRQAVETSDGRHPPIIRAEFSLPKYRGPTSAKAPSARRAAVLAMRSTRTTSSIPTSRRTPTSTCRPPPARPRRPRRRTSAQPHDSATTTTVATVAGSDPAVLRDPQPVRQPLGSAARGGAPSRGQRPVHHQHRDAEPQLVHLRLPDRVLTALDRDRPSA